MGHQLVDRMRDPEQWLTRSDIHFLSNHAADVMAALIAALEQARLAITYALGARENEMIAMAAEAHCKLALDEIHAALTAARAASATGAKEDQS